MALRASVPTRVGDVDALPVLVCYVVVLLGIPSELIVSPLGAAGTPAQIIGIGLLAWWMASRIIIRRSSSRSNPVKWLLLLFVVAMLAAYMAGMTRAINSTTEVNSSDRAILSLCAWCGVVLVLADGITSRARLDRLLQVVAGGATAIAVLGMVQFFFKIDIAHLFKIPGLSANHSFGGLIDRGAYQRVTGTTQHPIEFGVVLSSALPLAIHFARFSARAVQRRRWWIATGLIAAALPMSVARSAILGAAIVIIYLFHTWPTRLKIRAAIAGGLGAFAMSFAVPGLLGTIKGLFLNASSDPSTQGRTADYAPVFRYTGERPLFGRGIGTFVPDLYRTLDNQYLGTLVEAGLFGLLSLLTLFIGTACVAGAIRRRTDSESTRDLAQGLKAGVVALAVNAATFDIFGFSMAAGITFLLIGSVAALRSIEAPVRAEGVLAPSTSKRRRPGRVSAAAGIGLLLCLTVYVAERPTVPEFQAYGTMILIPPALPQQPAFSTAGSAGVITSVLHDVVTSQPVREILQAQGAHDYEVAIGDGSLMMGTDQVGNGGPTLHVVATASTANGADTDLSVVIAEVKGQLARLQNQAGVPANLAINIDVLSTGQAFPVFGRPARARAGFLALGILVTLAVVQVGRLRERRGGLEPSTADVASPQIRVPVSAGAPGGASSW